MRIGDTFASTCVNLPKDSAFVVAPERKARPLSSVEAGLAEALRQRLSIIADEASRRHPQQHLAKLKSISQKIAALQKQLPQPIDPQLAHFLAHCSYDKALALLEAADNSSSLA